MPHGGKARVSKFIIIIIIIIIIYLFMYFFFLFFYFSSNISMNPAIYYKSRSYL